MIIIALISILTVAGLAWAFNRVLPFRVCPVCAGVAGTWLWMLIARLNDYGIEPALITMLMGGSVVGIAYQLEKLLPPGRSPVMFKAIFVPVGFAAAYALVWPFWDLFVPAAAATVGVALVFLKWPHPTPRAGPTPGHRKELEDLEEKMKSCC